MKDGLVLIMRAKAWIGLDRGEGVGELSQVSFMNAGRRGLARDADCVASDYTFRIRAKIRFIEKAWYDITYIVP